MEYKITVKNIPHIEIIHQEEKQNVTNFFIILGLFILVVGALIYISDGNIDSSRLVMYFVLGIIAMGRSFFFFLIVLGRLMEKRRINKEALIMGERDIYIEEDKVVIKSNQLDVIYEYTDIKRVFADNDSISIKGQDSSLNFHKYYFENDDTYDSFCQKLREQMLKFDPHLVTRIN